MLTIEQHRRIYWNTVNAEKHSRYYSSLSSTCRIIHLVLSTFVIILSSSAIWVLLDANNSNKSPWLLLAVVILTTIDFVFDFSGKASTFLFMKNECMSLAKQWDTVMQFKNSTSSIEEVVELEKRLDYVTGSDDIVIGFLDKRTEEKAKLIVNSKYYPEEQTKTKTH